MLIGLVQDGDRGDRRPHRGNFRPRWWAGDRRLLPARGAGRLSIIRAGRHAWLDSRTIDLGLVTPSLTNRGYHRSVVDRKRKDQIDCGSAPGWLQVKSSGLTVTRVIALKDRG